MPVQTDMMNTTAMPTYHAFSPELETEHVRPNRMENNFSRAGVIGTSQDSDAGAVDCETNLAPLVDCQRARDYLRDVFGVLQDAGADARSVGIGMHVHISNGPIVGVVDEDTANEFCQRSIEHKENTGRVIFQDHPELQGDPITFEMLKQICLRYTVQQAVIDTMHPPSRTGMHMARPLSQRALTRADIDASNVTDISSLVNATHGKFSTINLQHWTGYKTMEFRQAAGTIDFNKCYNWVAFLLNLVAHTVHNQFPRTETRTDVATPETGALAFPRPNVGRRQHMIYDMCRTATGATVQELSMATGAPRASVARAIVAIRQRTAPQAVVTHTQQTNVNPATGNNATYGDGDDLCRYQVLENYSDVVLGDASFDATVNPSIWAGLTDAQFDWWQDRIDRIAAQNPR